MALIKPYPIVDPLTDYKIGMQHWSELPPNLFVPIHLFGWWRGIENPYGAQFFLVVPGESEAIGLSCALFAAHSVADQCCANCRLFDFGPAVPRMGGIRRSKTPRTYDPDFPNHFIYPPAIYVGRFIDWNPDTLPYTDWGSPYATHWPASYSGGQTQK